MSRRPLDIRVVLVRPQNAGNIGSSARAVHNMGGRRLIVIDPQCRINDEAKKFASTAMEILESRVEYKSWDEFEAAEPESIRFAFTARDGADRLTRPFGELLERWSEEHPGFESEGEAPLTVHLVFGPEQSGMTAEDISRLHAAALLPVYGENPSLNLSQAVLLGMFMLQDRWGGPTKGPRFSSHATAPAPEKFPEDALREWLNLAGFELESRPQNAFTILRRLILRAAPTARELQVLEGTLRGSTKEMKKKS